MQNMIILSVATIITAIVAVGYVNVQKFNDLNEKVSGVENVCTAQKSAGEFCYEKCMPVVKSNGAEDPEAACLARCF